MAARAPNFDSLVYVFLAKLLVLLSVCLLLIGCFVKVVVFQGWVLFKVGVLKVLFVNGGGKNKKQIRKMSLFMACHLGRLSIAWPKTVSSSVVLWSKTVVPPCLVEDRGYAGSAKQAECS